MQPGKLYTPVYEFFLDTKHPTSPGYGYVVLHFGAPATPNEVFMFLGENRFLRMSNLTEHTVQYQNEHGAIWSNLQHMIYKMFCEID